MTTKWVLRNRSRNGTPLEPLDTLLPKRRKLISTDGLTKPWVDVTLNV